MASKRLGYIKPCCFACSAFGTSSAPFPSQITKPRSTSFWYIKTKLGSTVFHDRSMWCTQKITPVQNLGLFSGYTELAACQLTAEELIKIPELPQLRDIIAQTVFCLRQQMADTSGISIDATVPPDAGLVSDAMDVLTRPTKIPIQYDPEIVEQNELDPAILEVRFDPEIARMFRAEANAAAMVEVDIFANMEPTYRS